MKCLAGDCGVPLTPRTCCRQEPPVRSTPLHGSCLFLLRSSSVVMEPLELLIHPAFVWAVSLRPFLPTCFEIYIISPVAPSP
jgi:hypothetical protein